MNGLTADIGITRGDLTLGIALSIEPGQTVALLGPNGSGKTTAIEALAGLLKLDSGRIVLDGVTLDEPNRRVFLAAEQRHIGVVFQHQVLFPHMTALDNIAFGLRTRGTDRRRARAAAAEWLERLGVERVAGQKPSALSGGEAQRVALARALAVSPDLLLLDEPLSALDATAHTEMRRLLSDHLASFGGPSLIVTHSALEAFLLADIVHVIEDGEVTQVGSPNEIRLRPQTPYIADLAGVNLFEGAASAGRVLVGGFELSIADSSQEGPVIATIDPRAVAVHRSQPDGSPRNTWQTTVVRVEQLGDRVRLQFEVPVSITAEITPRSLERLGIEQGSVVWVAIKATEIRVESA